MAFVREGEETEGRMSRKARERDEGNESIKRVKMRQIGAICKSV